MGPILEFGAEWVRKGSSDQTPYNTAKGATRAPTTSIARGTATLGITYNCVAPAATGGQSDRLWRRHTTGWGDAEQAYVAAVNEERDDGPIPIGGSAKDEEHGRSHSIFRIRRPLIDRWAGAERQRRLHHGVTAGTRRRGTAADKCQQTRQRGGSHKQLGKHIEERS